MKVFIFIVAMLIAVIVGRTLLLLIYLTFKGEKSVFFAILYIILNLLGSIGVIYILVHFITKYW